ncbi:manganese transport system membrane protein MntC [Geobacter sp. OR-1]|uniref:metal ABC transporter permease n=1 Tax=Geobacter sp. OR-1 TaxID=1266765 RepID=UPI000542ADAB|nr:metal ABC transporter permease [Geobacter sp. OR-1]GAM09614.1 manganese transport system membrane protein MntC [Geobacter sp. OR-1]
MGITETLSYSFMQRALLAGSLIGVLCAVLGCFLVLRRLSLIGDGLAHVTFGSVALALFFKLYSAAAILVSLPVVMLCSLGILRLSERARMTGDTAIGIVSSLGIAAGVLLASLGGGFNVDLFSYLFGNILAISREEVLLAITLCGIVLVLVTFFYNDLMAMTFNEELARVSGVRTRGISAMLVLLTALTVVLAMKVVGIMLISALLILPSSAALQLAKGFRAALLLSAGLAVTGVITGIFASVGLNLPTGATIVLVNFGIFALVYSGKRLWARD